MSHPQEDVPTARHFQRHDLSISAQIAAAKRLIDGLRNANLLDDDEGFIADTLEGETDFVEAMSRLVVEDLADEAQMASLDVAMSQLADRRSRIEARKIKRRGLMLNALSDVGVKTLPTPAGTITARAGGQQLIENGDATTAGLPEQFLKRSVSFDRKAIKDALVGGGTVKGFDLSNAAPSLTIRTK